MNQTGDAMHPDAPGPGMTAVAAVFDGPGRPFRLVEVPIPTSVPAGFALVRIRLATVCGSDLHTCLGRRPGHFPAILGHEGVGDVVALGAGREDARVGDRVTWPLTDRCGHCHPCTDWNLPQKCDHLFKYGHEPLAVDGGLTGCYATHILLRPGTELLAVPPDLPDELVAPANCALATVLAVTESLPHPCRVAWVQGCGLLGLYTCAVLRSRGVQRIAVSDPNPDRRRLAVRFGADPDWAEAGSGPGAGTADVVVEVAGVPQVVPAGVEALRPGGHYLLAGMVLPGPNLALGGESVVRKCLTIRGTHNYAPRHLQQALGFLRTHRDAYPWQSLVSPPLPLEAMNEALQLAAGGRWARVSIRP